MKNYPRRSTISKRKANLIFSFSCEIMIMLLFRHCLFSKSHAKLFLQVSFLFHVVISEQLINLYYNECINNAIYTFKLNEFFHGNFYQDLRKQIGIHHTIFSPWLAFVLRVNQIPNKMKVKAQQFTGNDLRFISSME